MLLWKMLGRDNATYRARSCQPEPFRKFNWHQREGLLALPPPSPGPASDSNWRTATSVPPCHLPSPTSAEQVL